MTLLKVDLTFYFDLVKEEKKYLGQSGYSGRYLKDFAKKNPNQYQDLLNYDILLRSEIYFRQKQDYLDLIQNYLETKSEFENFSCQFKALQK